MLGRRDEFVFGFGFKGRAEVIDAGPGCGAGITGILRG